MKLRKKRQPITWPTFSGLPLAARKKQTPRNVVPLLGTRPSRFYAFFSVYAPLRGAARLRDMAQKTLKAKKINII